MSTERQESKLIRNLGFWDLMAIAVGQIIGAGIMSSTGVAIGMTGTGVVLAFLISPFLTIISIFPVAILSSAVPTTGGPYRYCSRLVSKSFGMIYLLLHVTSYSIAVSQYSLSFGAYFSSIVPSVNQHVAAMVILTLFYAMNLVGTKSAALLNKIISFALFGGLGLFVLFGLPKTDLGYVMNPVNLFPNGPLMFVSTLALLSSATAGAQFIAELDGEAKDPGRTIPKVMVTPTFGVGVFYVLIAVVAAGVLPIAQVADQPLTLVAEATMPKVAMYLFVIGAALGATSSTLNSTLSWITKPLLVACDDGVLPRSLGSVSKNGVPYKLLTFFYIIGMLPLLLRFDISFITRFTTANSLLAKLMVCVALFALAAKYGDILQRSTMKISTSAAKTLAVLGIVILCVLSYSLFVSLSGAVVIFLAVLVAVSLVYFEEEIGMENMEYYTQRLQCSDEEKDACLETVAKLCRLRYLIRRDGGLAAEALAEEEPTPFFRVCLLDFAYVWEPEELERRFTQYLMAGDYRGGAFLNAVLISRGLILLARYEGGEVEAFREKHWNKTWGELLGETLRGWFGVEYREKVMAVIKREEKTWWDAEPKQEHDSIIWRPEPGQDHASLLREFDGLIELTPPQRDWLVRNTSTLILCLAMQAGGTQVNEYLKEGVENREQLERGLELTANVRVCDVEAAQQEILERAEEARTCM